MKENDVKPEQLAVRIGVSYATIRNLMAGKKTFRPTIIVLSQLMGVSEAELATEPKQKTGGRKATGS
jgi:plasmid maintenance system antidote protein VapI